MALLVKTAGMVVKKVMGTEVVGKVADRAGSMIDKAVDRHYEKQKILIRLPDVKDLSVSEAKAHLEDLGFEVRTTLQHPHSKHRNKMPDTVVAMMPKPGKVTPRSLIKLYYVNETVIRDSHKTMELPDVVGMTMDRATRLLEQQGFRVVPILLTPRKEYANKLAGLVLRMTPAPSLIKQQIKRDSIIKLRYLDQDGIDLSRQLREQTRRKLAMQTDRVAHALSTGKKALHVKPKKQSSVQAPDRPEERNS